MNLGKIAWFRVGSIDREEQGHLYRVCLVHVDSFWLIALLLLPRGASDYVVRGPQSDNAAILSNHVWQWARLLMQIMWPGTTGPPDKMRCDLRSSAH